MTAALLSVDKRDALQELVNIGMGAAGAALAKALGAFVQLAVPGVDVLDRRRVATLLDDGSWANQEVEAVRQPFFGAFMGESVMVFDGHTHGELCDLLGYGPDSSAGDRQPLNEIISFAPTARLGGRAEIHALLSRGPEVLSQGLVVNVDFKLEGRAFLSRVLVFLPEHSLAKIDQALTRLLDGLAAG